MRGLPAGSKPDPEIAEPQWGLPGVTWEGEALEGSWMFSDLTGARKFLYVAGK